MLDPASRNAAGSLRSYSKNVLLTFPRNNFFQLEELAFNTERFHLLIFQLPSAACGENGMTRLEFILESADHLDVLTDNVLENNRWTEVISCEQS